MTSNDVYLKKLWNVYSAKSLCG